MTSNTMPTNAQDWGAFLAEKSLPSPFRVGKLVLQAMQRDDLSYHHIAEKLNSDPVLAYNIMAKANNEKPGSNPTSKTLDHAISMIGIDPLSQIINKLPFQEVDSENISAFYYIRSLSSSLFAGYLGRAICQRRKLGNEEDIYWSSLFYGVPIWTLWRFATPEMRLVRYAIRNNYKLPEVAEQEVLGCTLLEASSEMVKKLGLSDLVKDCYNPKYQLSNRQWIRISKLIDKDGRFTHPSDDRDLMMVLQTPQIMIQIANMLAYHSTHDWYSRACLRTQRILAAYLKCSLDEAIQLSHEVAAEVSRKHPIPGLLLPAAKLFLEPRLRLKADPKAEDHNLNPETLTAAEPKAERKSEPEPAKASAAEPSSASKAAEPEENPMFKELTEIMLHRPEEFTDLHELMNAATQGIAYGLSLKRSFVCLVNNDSTRLKNYYTVGAGENSELRTFEMPLVKTTIFGKLIERPASVWIKSDSPEKIKKLVPSNFKQVIQVEEFVLMSVFVGKRPVAIFYADNDDIPLTEIQYKKFKYMCGAVSTALLHQANARRKNKT